MTETLGRGLSALIPAARKGKGTDTVRELAPDAIDANPFQPRTDFDAKELEELKKSIAEHGILQPLVITPSKVKNRYELIAGERRLTAAKALRMKRVPVVIRAANRQQKLELALIENIQRADLNPIERALGYRKLIDEFSLTQEQVAKRVGKSRESVANGLRLLTLPDEYQQAIRAGRITEGHAKVLLSLRDEQKRREVFREMLKGLTVAESTKAVKSMHKKLHAARRSAKSTAMSDYEDRLRAALGTKVELSGTEQSGEIRIHYYSEEELRSLTDQLS